MARLFLWNMPPYLGSQKQMSVFIYWEDEMNCSVLTNLKLKVIIKVLFINYEYFMPLAIITTCSSRHKWLDEQVVIIANGIKYS